MKPRWLTRSSTFWRRSSTITAPPCIALRENSHQTEDNDTLWNLLDVSQAKSVKFYQNLADGISGREPDLARRGWADRYMEGEKAGPRGARHDQGLPLEHRAARRPMGRPRGASHRRGRAEGVGRHRLGRPREPDARGGRAGLPAVLPRA